MNTSSLRSRLLSLAIHGQLVPQDPNDEPASALLARIQAEKANAEKGKKRSAKPSISVENAPFVVPEGWCWTTLGEIFQHNNGKQKSSSNTEGEMFKYITTCNVYWGKFDFSDVKEMKFTESEYDKCTAVKGDLLVCEGGDIGRAAIWNYDYPIKFQNHLHRLRAYLPLCTEFYLYVLMYNKSQNLIKGKGIGLMSLSANDLHNILVPLPPLAEQRRIVSKIEEIFREMERIEGSL